MTEKRFICGLGFPINSDDPIRIITDREKDKDYFKFSDICEIMNEQQAKIQKQEKIIKALEDDHKRQENEIKLLRQEYSKIPPKIREVWKE